ncbi:hypothetical protein [Streptomyces sp. 5-10]|uniref:hypothetical protein n=1 Tax=Streptomyces sp. 5-10 TaxID=878925 RepID=UPI00168A73FF|nr:hypothetical protein [Streptomyces sp. 5-10]MBD3004692.1 hypothetical protein [Streptomyces sp. 5-10]
MNESLTVQRGRKVKLTHTEVHDWTLFTPASHGAKVMFVILRSMCIEKEDDGARIEVHAPTRVLTIDRLCWLASNALGKPVGERTVRDYRNELEKVGLIEVRPGRLPSDPPAYLIHDEPPEGWNGWRNAWHVDDEYTDGWRANWGKSVTQGENGHSGVRSTAGCDETPGENGANHPAVDRTLRTTAGGRRHTAGGRRHTAGHPGGDLGVSVPKKESKNPPQEDARARAREAAGVNGVPPEEEAATPSTPEGSSPSSATPSPEAVRVVRGITGLKVFGAVERGVAVEVDRALVNGYPAEEVRRHLGKARWARIGQPVRFVASEVDRYFSEPFKVKPRLNVNKCPECQNTMGWIEDAEGNQVGRCDHARLAQCPDCEGSGYRLNGGGHCSHEASPVPRRDAGGRLAA